MTSPWLPIDKSIKNRFTFKLQGGDDTKEGSLDPSDESDHANDAPRRSAQGIEQCTQTPFLNPDPFQQWHGVENVAKVRINGESCMALLDNGTQINTIIPSYVKSCSLKVGLITDLVGRWVACVGLENTYTQPLGYVIVQVQVEGVQGYNKDQIALVVLDLSNFMAWVPVILGTPTISCVVNVMKEKEIDALVTPWANAWVAHLLSVQRVTATVEDNPAVGKSIPNEYEEVVITKNTETIDAFSSHVIPVKAEKAYTGERINVMTQALQVEDGSLPQGLTMQNAYTELRTGRKNAVVVVRNSTAYLHTLKKKTLVAQAVVATAVPELLVMTNLPEGGGASQSSNT